MTGAVAFFAGLWVADAAGLGEDALDGPVCDPEVETAADGDAWAPRVGLECVGCAGLGWLTNPGTIGANTL